MQAQRRAALLGDDDAAVNKIDASIEKAFLAIEKFDAVIDETHSRREAARRAELKQNAAVKRAAVAEAVEKVVAWSAEADRMTARLCTALEAREAAVTELARIAGVRRHDVDRPWSIPTGILSRIRKTVPAVFDNARNVMIPSADGVASLAEIDRRAFQDMATDAEATELARLENLPDDAGTVGDAA